MHRKGNIDKSKCGKPDRGFYLNESLLDDVAIDDVEDVDVETDDDMQYNTVMRIRAVNGDTETCLPKCVDILTNRHSHLMKVCNNCMGFTFDRNRVAPESMAGFMAALFSLSGCGKTLIGIDAYRGEAERIVRYVDYKYSVEWESSNLIVGNKNKLAFLFGISEHSESVEETLFKMIASAAIGYMRKTGKIDSDRYVVARWKPNSRNIIYSVSPEMVFTKFKTAYKTIYGFEGNILALVTSSENGEGDACFVDVSGNRICDEWWLEANDTFGEYGLCAVRNKNGKWNFVDASGKYRFGDFLDADDVVNFNNGYAKIYRPDGTKGFMDIDGNFLKIDAEANKYINGSPKDGFICLYDSDTGNSNYLRVSDGTYLLKYWIHEYPCDFEDGYAVVGNFGSTNILRADGKFVFSKWYYDVGFVKYGMTVVEDEKHMRNIADMDGKILLKSWYRSAMIVNENLIQFRTTSNDVITGWFILNLKTKESFNGYAVKYYDDCRLIYVQTGNGKYNIMDEHMNKLFMDGFGREYRVPVFKDGMFFMTDGLTCIRFDTEGNIVSAL